MIDVHHRIGVQNFSMSQAAVGMPTNQRKEEKHAIMMNSMLTNRNGICQ